MKTKPPKKSRSLPRAPRGSPRSATDIAEGPTNKNREERWQHLCDELRSEMGRMSQEIAALRAERDQYLRAVYALTWEDIDFDKKEILAQAGKGPSLDELIAELESKGVR